MILFSLPFQKNISTVQETSENSAMSFFDFEGLEKVSFNGEIVDTLPDKLVLTGFSTEGLPYFNNVKSIINKEDYLIKIENVIKIINENHLEKLVFSRRKAIYFQEINLVKSFQNLKQNYPNALSYLFLKNGVCWIGAFSEILGKFNKETSEFETMSLAGTLPIKDDWSSKEVEEQKSVTKYIRNILSNYSSEIVESETYNHISGNIKHLRTDFKIKVESKSIENLVSELHPTPAVCGFPKDISINAIQNFEKYPRELYAGYSRIETEEYLYYFVNLRCAKIYKNTAVLFVGGGINKDSQPEKEWLETELKAEAIANNLIIF